LIHSIYSAIGRFCVRFRWPVLAVWVIATILAGSYFPSLSSVIKSDNTDFLPHNAPSSVADRLASPLQNSKLTPVPVVVSATTGTLGTADIPYVQKLVAAVKGVNEVVQVRDRGVSPDRAAYQLQVLANLDRGESGPAKKLINGLTSAIAALPRPPNVQTHVAGQVADQIDQSKKSGDTGKRVQSISVLFILILLMLIFRSPLAPIVTLAPAFLVVQLAGGIVAELTKAGLSVSSLAQVMMIILLLGAGTDYGLFLIFRVREEIRAGLTPHDAIVRSVERVGESITFSAGTVIAALLSLLAATFGIYSSLGAPLAIAIAIMLLAGLTLLPALLAVLGRAVFWPTNLEQRERATPMWGRVAGRVVARPAVTLVIGLVVFGGLAAMVSAYTAAGFGNALTAPAGSDAAKGDAALAAHFPRAASNPTNLVFRFARPVWQHPSALDKAQRQLAAAPVFNEVTGPTRPNGATLGGARFARLHAQLGDPRSLPATPPPGTMVSGADYELYRTESNYISRDGRTVQYLASLTAGEASTTSALHAVPEIRRTVTAVATQVGASQSGVAGEAPGIYDVSATSNHDLRTVIPIAILVIGVLLALVMRSLVAPLYLIVSVALSYLAALGLCVLLFQTIGGSGGLTFLLPFLMFLFLLALGEDYNILVMTRIREEAHHLPLRDAVRRAIGATGSTVTSAGLVLAGTFAVFAIVGGRGSGGSQFRDLGAGLSIGILMDTFLVRTLLVPSTVALLGRWNWWPSRLGEQETEG
jgi:RND superfamily putative drug exporter